MGVLCPSTGIGDGGHTAPHTAVTLLVQLWIGFVLSPSSAESSPQYPKGSGGMRISVTPVSPADAGLCWSSSKSSRGRGCGLLSGFFGPVLCHVSLVTLAGCTLQLWARRVSSSEETSQVRQDWGSGSLHLVVMTT